MRPKPHVVLVLTLLLTMATQARHKSAESKAIPAGTSSTAVVKKAVKTPVGHDLSPVQFLVLDI